MYRFRETDTVLILVRVTRIRHRGQEQPEEERADLTHTSIEQCIIKGTWGWNWNRAGT